MNVRMKFLAAAAMCAAGIALAAPASAADFLGIPLWESYPGEFSYDYNPPSTYYYYNYTAQPPHSNYAPYYNLNRPYYYDTYGYPYDPYYNYNSGQGSGMYDRFGR